MIAQNVLRVFGYLILAVAALVAAFMLFAAATSADGPNLFGLGVALGVLFGGAVIASLFLAVATALERLESIDAEAKKQTERLEYLARVQYEALNTVKGASASQARQSGLTQN